MPYISFSLSRLSRFFLLLSLGFLFTVSGCTTRSQPDASLGESGTFGIDAPEETVEAPYKPIDDGEPLTPAEQAAFHSTGELDAALSDEEKQLVELHFKFFVHKHRKVMERFLARSEPYLPYVKHIFKSRGLPEEAAYLAYVESGFNPNAVSPAGAGGMWQFMPFTGKKYGLAQDYWVDERRDPFKATESAAAYLTKLYDYFGGDWLLAIAAYNAGEGKIGKALAGTDAKTFFEICRKNHMLDDRAQLREETQQYVPRFLAVTKIMRNLKQLGFTEPDPKRALSVVPLTVPAGVELASFARSANLSWDQFSLLNPAYRRHISPPGTSSQAYVPYDREQQAKTWLADKSVSVYAGWREHKVRKGDSMGSIAARSGSSTALLRRANGRQSNSLKVGEFLLVPGSSRAAQATQAKLFPGEQSGKIRLAGPAKGMHTVAAGDTLYGLASRWDTSVDAICDANDMERSAKLRIGQKLRIPAEKQVASGPVEQTPQAEAAVKPARSLALVGEAKASTPAAKPAPAARAASYITVQPGDTLYSLARANGCSVEDLCGANQITPKAKLRVGQKLRLIAGTGMALQSDPPRPADAHADKKKTAAAAAKGKFAVVQSGDTLSGVARANNTTTGALAKLNGISPASPLKAGQLLRLP